MPPTPPSHDDALDLDGLDLKPSGAKKSTAAAESDFEKELEALFAEELASSDEKPASAPPVGASGEPEPEEPAPLAQPSKAAEPADLLDEDALLLDDLIEDVPAAPKASASKAADLPESDEDILDLSAFGAGGDLELLPPDETAGNDGVIDLDGLDELISGMGDAKAAAPASAPAAASAVESTVEPEPAGAASLDAVDMADLLGDLDVPAASAPAGPLSDAEDEPLELSLGDLVPEGEPTAAPAPQAAEAALDEDILDLTLPDLSDPEPGRDLISEQEQADMGGELNLSLDDLAPAASDTLPGTLAEILDEAPESATQESATQESATAVDQLLGDELDMGGLMEGIESAAGEAEVETSLDAEALLAQIPDADVAAPAPTPEAVIEPEPVVIEPEPAVESEPVIEPEAAAAEPEMELPELLQPVLEAEPEGFVADAAESSAPLADQPVEPVAEPIAEPVTPSADALLADAALASAVTAALATGPAVLSTESVEPVESAEPAEVVAAPAEPEPVAAAPAVSLEEVAALRERLEQLATQVTGNSVAVVRLEGKLAQREQTLTEIEERLRASETEAESLRQELAALRAHMEESLRAQDEAVQQELAQSAQSAADKSQAAMDKALGAVDKALAALDKAQMASDKADSLAPRVESAEMTVRGAGARITQLENRQTQLDREVFAEITRAVPREAAKVIREEIAHLAASMRDE